MASDHTASSSHSQALSENNPRPNRGIPSLATPHREESSAEPTPFLTDARSARRIPDQTGRSPHWQSPSEKNRRAHRAIHSLTAGQREEPPGDPQGVLTRQRPSEKNHRGDRAIHSLTAAQREQSPGGPDDPLTGNAPARRTAGQVTRSSHPQSLNEKNSRPRRLHFSLTTGQREQPPGTLRGLLTHEHSAKRTSGHTMRSIH